jgi:hypothetical protein
MRGLHLTDPRALVWHAIARHKDQLGAIVTEVFRVALLPAFGICKTVNMSLSAAHKATGND